MMVTVPLTAFGFESEAVIVTIEMKDFAKAVNLVTLLLNFLTS
jgi:hypothetical protein